MLASAPGLDWTEVTNKFLPSLGRNAHSSVVFDNQLWVIAGAQASDHFFNDVWRSRDGVSWTQVTNDAGFPARWHHSSVVFNKAESGSSEEDFPPFILIMLDFLTMCGAVRMG